MVATSDVGWRGADAWAAPSGRLSASELTLPGTALGPLAPILESVARAVCGPLTRFSYAEAWAWDEGTGTLRCAAAVRASPGDEEGPEGDDPAVEAFRRRAEGSELAADADVVGRCAAARRCEWLVDCSACPADAFARGGPGCPFRALFALPALQPSSSSPAAVLLFFSPRAMEYDAIVDEFVRVTAAVALFRHNAVCPALPPAAARPAGPLDVDPCSLDLLRIDPATRSEASADFIDRAFGDRAPLFAKFPSLRRRLFRGARLERYPRGHRLCVLGEPLSRALVILSGSVRCAERPAADPGAADSWLMGPGESLGETCLLGRPCASLVTATCESEVTAVEVDASFGLPREGPPARPLPRRDSLASVASCSSRSDSVAAAPSPEEGRAGERWEGPDPPEARPGTRWEAPEPSEGAPSRPLSRSASCSSVVSQSEAASARERGSCGPIFQGEAPRAPPAAPAAPLRAGGAAAEAAAAGPLVLRAVKRAHPAKRKRETISYEMVARQFHLGLKEAADALGVCPTTLKMVCRELGIAAWPSRRAQAPKEGGPGAGKGRKGRAAAGPAPPSSGAPSPAPSPPHAAAWGAPDPAAGEPAPLDLFLDHILSRGPH